MPNVKKPNERTSAYRRTLTLTSPTAKRVEEMAREEQRPVASMLRILIERGLEREPATAK